ncbi:Abi family protein [Helicobacter equorum]|uniref:Abi family protein n=1 Tax=Helicobacter equorum TaxID=361872 RepID=UPI001F1C5126|nr:Abi family protein [Helicobacter equorum]
MNYPKSFKTISELLEILKNRGLIINDDKFASDFLYNVNYYRLSAYFIPFYKSENVFKSNITFENICDLYEFDKELRGVIFKYLEQIEIILRTRISHIHAREYGVFGYLNNENSLNRTYKRKKDNVKTLYKEFMEKVEQEKSRSNEVFIKHIKEKYKTNDLPIWALSEILSFGTLTKLYAILPKALKKEIANSFNKNLDIEIFDNWLLGLTVIRNTCAHHARIWNRKFTPSFKYPKKLNDFLSKEVKNNQIFFALSVMLVLLNNNKLKDELVSLFKKYPNVDTSEMGFMHNWQEFKMWRE